MDIAEIVVFVVVNVYLVAMMAVVVVFEIVDCYHLLENIDDKNGSYDHYYHDQ